MAISFASATGNLFNRIGSLGYLLKVVSAYQQAQLTNMTSVSTGTVTQYVSESDLQAIIGSQYITQLNSPGDSMGGMTSNVIQQTVNRMVFRDQPLQNQTLTSVNIISSIQNIILQMMQQNATVQACTIGSSIGLFPSISTNIGNGVINVSTKRPSDGRVQENTYAEVITFTCTNDSYLGGATAFNEGFSVTGEGNQSDFFAFNWPLGSNANVSFNAIDGRTSTGAGNLLTNSGFDTFVNVANIPDNWTLTEGAAGTNIFEESTIVYGTGNAIRIQGDAPGTLTSIAQVFDTTSGTSATLNPLTQYSFSIWACRDGVVPGAGVVTVSLTDGNGVVINDAAGVPNTFNINLTSLTSSYANYLGVFRTPLILPATFQINIGLSTALTNGRSVYFDLGSQGIMAKLYTGGPTIAIHSGSTAFAQGDYSTATFSNNRGGAADGLSTFQTLFQRNLPMMQNNLMLPSSASPSISDALIGP